MSTAPLGATVGLVPSLFATDALLVTRMLPVAHPGATSGHALSTNAALALCVMMNHRLARKMEHA